MSKIEDRIRELGHKLPPTPKPAAAYIPAKQAGSLVFTAGQLPMVGGELAATGRVGGPNGLSTEKAAELTRICCLNALAAVKSVTGDLDRIRQIVRIVVYVQSNDGYGDQPLVANGASEFVREVFGEAGEHARSAVGVNALPRNTPVELELTIEVD